MNPIAPSQGLTIYLEHREGDLAASSLRSYDYRLRFFTEWCNENGIDDLSELSARDIHDFKQWRRVEGHDGDGAMARPTLKSNMDCVRGFLRYMEKLDYTVEDISESAESPELRARENVSEDIVEREKAKNILDYLDKFRYASREHALFSICWHTAARTGSLRALDLSDYNSEDQFLSFCHRPEKGTPLKNKRKGERMVALSPEICVVIDDYISENRLETVDKHGREPLLTTRNNGRMACNTVRGWSYRMTCPSFYTNKCPHSGGDCKSSENSNYAYSCPESTAPHSIRRGAITAMLEDDVPHRIVSDRAQVSQAVLKKHYDARGKRAKMEQRRQFID